MNQNKLTPEQKADFERWFKERNPESKLLWTFDLGHKGYYHIRAWHQAGRPVVIAQVITDGHAIGMLDSAYGNLYLYDGKEWQQSSGHAISTASYTLTSEYYESFALFKRVA